MNTKRLMVGLSSESVVFLRTDGRRCRALSHCGSRGSVSRSLHCLSSVGWSGSEPTPWGFHTGCATDFPVHRDVSLPQGVWHVENLTNLGAVPPIGAWAVVGVPAVAGASGFPARVLAVVLETE